MASNQPGSIGPMSRLPPNVNQQQYAMYQQHQQQIDLEQKKLQDIMDALTYISNIRDDMNLILDNVGKVNTANNYANLLAGKSTATGKPGDSTSQDAQLKKQTSTSGGASTSGGQVPSVVATPGSVSNVGSQQPAGQQQQSAQQQQTAQQPQQLQQQQQQQQQAQTSGQTDQDPNQVSETADEFSNLDLEQQQFFEKTDTKFLQEKTGEIHKNLIELDRIIRDLQPIVIRDFPEFIPILQDQSDSIASGNRMISNYRWYSKVQDMIFSTSFRSTYKRYIQTYNDKKSTKYRSFMLSKPIRLEEIEKSVSHNLGLSEIKVRSAQKTENEFIIDIIMPQHFKFVILLFDYNLEKIQVRPLDIRLLKIYSNNKPSDEFCSFDFDHKNTSTVFQRLEENCLFACTYFRTEYGPNHLKPILGWIRYFTNLFNAKCVRCEKHLNNGLPPTWRDLKTNEPYHDQCRI